MTPTPFAALVILVGVLCSRTGLIYWQLALCLFGAAAAISLPALGGAVILPSTLFLPFLLLGAWADQHGKKYRMPIAGAWLALAVLCGVLTAFFVPRVLAGQIEIVTVDRTAGGVGIVLFPLRPVSGNLTQSAYAIGAVLSFLAMRVLLDKPGRLEHFRDATLLLASLDCFAGVLNLAEYHLGVPPLLTYVRTAYTLFDAYEASGTGLIRIHGTFSETSAFCGFSLPLFAFSFSLWLHKVRPLYTGLLSLILCVLLLISTSSTAYAGMCVYGAIMVFVLTYRGYVRGSVPRIGVLVTGSLLAVVLCGSTFVLETEIARRLESYVQLTMFDKLGSASGQERGLWNQQAWNNFLDTYGVGVGLGSARASSMALVLLSNLGFIGTLFYTAFLKRALVNTTRDVALEPVSEASRQALLAAISAAMISAGVFDMGVTFYAFAAAGSIVPPARMPRQVARYFVPRRSPDAVW